MNEIIRTLHILTGSIAIITGFAALIPKKGGKLHLTLGRYFFYSMTVMAASATFLALFHKSEEINAMIGLFTLYLVFTARWAANNRTSSNTSKEKVGAVAALVLFLLFLVLSINAYNSGETIIDGVYVEAFYVYLVLSFLAFYLDFKVLIKGGVVGAQRIARHLWRMTLALFISTGALFMGQPQVFPKFLRESGALNIPVLLVVLALFFWVIRVYVGKRFKMNKQ